jgi:hypothetical protein
LIGNFRTQDIACRKVLEPISGNEFLGLGALSTAGRTKKNEIEHIVLLGVIKENLHWPWQRKFCISLTKTERKYN